MNKTSKGKDTNSSVCKHSKKDVYKVDKAFQVWIKGYDKALLEKQRRELLEIVEKNEWMGGYDYDGIAEGLLRYLKIIK